MTPWNWCKRTLHSHDNHLSCLVVEQQSVQVPTDHSNTECKPYLVLNLEWQFCISYLPIDSTHYLNFRNQYIIRYATNLWQPFHLWDTIVGRQMLGVLTFFLTVLAVKRQGHYPLRHTHVVWSVMVNININDDLVFVSDGIYEWISGTPPNVATFYLGPWKD